MISHPDLIQLLTQALKNPISPDQVQLYSDVGNYKQVYKLKLDDKSLLAVAVAREADYDLYGEFKLLERLHDEVPEYFPDPAFYHERDGHRVMAMEFFPQPTIRQTKSILIGSRRLEELTAHQIGFALGLTHQRTGYITDEPHDDNILVGIETNPITIKLIDAAHFREGSLDELREAAYEQQDLCKTYRRCFNEGIRYGRDEA